MRRFTLSTKLFAAAMPLILAVTALLTLTVRADFHEISRAERSADLGGMWTPLSNALGAIEQEVTDGYTARLVDESALDAGRTRTDQALAEVSAAVNQLGLGAAAATHATDAQIAVRAGRTAADGIAAMNGTSSRIDPLESYESAARQLVSVGQLLPAVSDDADLGSELLAVVRLAEARLAATTVIHATTRWNTVYDDVTVLTEARTAYTQLEAVLAEFETTAKDEWALEYRNSGYAAAITDYRTQLDSVVRAAGRGEVRQFDVAGFSTLVQRGVAFEAEITQSIVDDANGRADTTSRTTLIRIAITLGAILAAGVLAWWMTRSITRRVKEVATSANQVATEQLPALVEALRDPRGRTVLPVIAPVSTRGGDELADLAEAFNSMQSTLVDVAHEQVEVLRRGVSDIFVTMARRNRSLIDRQLAMLDEFEAEVDDPDVLSNYYQLDHMATRMRRNSESLLVLANAEPKRRRVKATEIDDVVRAAIGEVEDYRRIEIEALESLQVKGNVVADVSHLLAELLDNATSFSPPDSLVRVGGRRAGDSYMLRIVDNGVGIGVERLRELNELLREPPIVGLSVEPTLGMSVVSLLANRHSISVTLSQGNPGTTVDVLLPSSLFGPIDVPVGGAVPATPVAAAADRIAPADTERFVEAPAAPSWTNLDLSTLRTDEPAPTYATTYEPAPAPVAAPAAFTAAEYAPAPAPVAPVPAPLLAPTEISFGAPVVAEHEVVLPPPPPAPAPVLVPAAATAEFDRPLAPPPTADGPSRQPVVPADAHPAPAMRTVAPPAADPLLPTRTASRGPDGGVDRLASFGADGERSVTTTSSPSALQAALAAFDSRRSGDAETLPSRPRTDDFGAPEDTTSVSQSRLDPDALRERLRAFQTEFRTGTAGADTNHISPNADLGGDRR
jgi:signal transduction histidine kinase